MSSDIHMHIISNSGEYKYNDLFDGVRNYEWFDNICDKYHSNFCYDSFPKTSGIPDFAPEAVKKDKEDVGYFDFFYVKVGEFLEWFNRLRPDVDAGWVSTYEMWLYQAKGIAPDEIPHELDEDCNALDYHFMEIEDPEDMSRVLFEFIVDHKDIGLEDYIIYYFDN